METITAIWAWIMAHRVEIVEAAGLLVGAASIVVRLTPTKRDDEALSWFRVHVLERLSVLQPRDGKGLLSLPGWRANR